MEDLKNEAATDFTKESAKEKFLTLMKSDSCYITQNKDFARDVRYATKCWNTAKERKIALEKLGFLLSKNKLVGNDSTEYTDYWVKSK